MAYENLDAQTMGRERHSNAAQEIIHFVPNRPTS